MLSLSIQVLGPIEHTEPQSNTAPLDSVLSFRVAGLSGECVQTRQDVADKRVLNGLCWGEAREE